jgi:hypothetical protein
VTSKRQKQIAHSRRIAEITHVLIAGHRQKLSKARLGEGRIVRIGRRAQALPKRQIRNLGHAA